MRNKNIKYERNNNGEIEDIILTMSVKIGSHSDYKLYVDYDAVHNGIVISDNEEMNYSSRCESVTRNLYIKDNKIMVQNSWNDMTNTNWDYELRDYRSLKQEIRAGYFRNFSAFFCAMLLREYDEDIKVFFELMKKYILSNR